jgi:hypothetical protein
MTVAVEQGNTMAEYDNTSKDILPREYGCEILLEKTTIEQAKNSSFPNDAYLIWYQIENKTHMDLIRGSRVRIFDMYYDKYGPGSVKKIDFGYGRTNPKLWRYQKESNTKKR